MRKKRRSPIYKICGRTVLEALDNMCECTCSAAVVENGIESSFNRRKRPFIDRRVKAAVFNGPDGKIRGVISSGCCHPVINTTIEISADYLQVLTRRSIEEHGVPFLFLQGRGADINPCTFEDMDIEEVMEKVGSELADAVACAVRKAGGNQESIDSVQNIYTPAAIPVKPFETVEEAEKKLHDKFEAYLDKPWSLEKHYAFRELEWHRRMYRKIRRCEKPEVHVPIQLLKIGEHLIFVFLPFEVLTNTGNKIEEILCHMGYREEYIFIIGCANSVNSYLTPLEEIPFGGYEVTRAAHWYGLPEYGKCTEKNVIDIVEKIAAGLK